MGMCNKCSALTGGLVFVFGVILLLKDLNVWNFWGINWFTVLFLLFGITYMCSSGCSACYPETKKKR